MRRSRVRVPVSAPKVTLNAWHIRGISTSVVHGLPKPGRRVRLPYSAHGFNGGLPSWDLRRGPVCLMGLLLLQNVWWIKTWDLLAKVFVSQPRFLCIYVYVIFKLIHMTSSCIKIKKLDPIHIPSWIQANLDGESQCRVLVWKTKLS